MINLPKRLKGQHASVKRSKVQEAKTARALGGRITKASGSGEHEKGDVRLQRVARIECKTTKASSFRVTREMLDKIEMQALAAGEFPAMVIEIDNDTNPREVAVVPMWVLRGLVESDDGVR